MARFKPVHIGLKLLPVDLERQVIRAVFEYVLCKLVHQELDLSAFHARYKNDVEGASAFDPAALINIILLAYSRGILWLLMQPLLWYFDAVLGSGRPFHYVSRHVRSKRFKNNLILRIHIAV